ncbi:amidohydrolase family protein [Sphingobacteriaceae bacterium AH-315-L07]|nr:amidohydrolase family protein [Bacteroidia bacterium]MBN4052239.1 amidohydrolase family protein [Sphingobacteriaceae bacterium AH-315-L07]
MRKITADYIFPISSPPVKQGVVLINNDGTIKSVVERDQFELSELEVHDGFITPGFVNAHCHLELSYLKNKISEKTGLVDFITKIIELRNEFDEETIQLAIEESEKEMIANGIVAVGDISNTINSFSQKSKSNILYHTFIELMGFHPDVAEVAFNNGLDIYESIPGSNKSVTPHGPYSVSEQLFHKINIHAKKNNYPLSIHIQESVDENKLFQSKEGDLIEFYKKLNIDLDFFESTQRSSLLSVIPYLEKEFKILLVHNTFTTPTEIKWIEENYENVWWCFCPKANLYIEETLPEFTSFMQNNCKITVGTDSLASNNSLSILDELKVISQTDPKIPLNTLLTWATKNGAEFLRFENTLGTLEKGKSPGLNLIKDVDNQGIKMLSESYIETLL